MESCEELLNKEWDFSNPYQSALKALKIQRKNCCNKNKDKDIMQIEEQDLSKLGVDYYSLKVTGSPGRKGRCIYVNIRLNDNDIFYSVTCGIKEVKFKTFNEATNYFNSFKNVK